MCTVDINSNPDQSLMFKRTRTDIPIRSKLLKPMINTTNTVATRNHRIYQTLR